jgi:2-polyprenyl-3-methyl-5-hydroxy-6-metoxy-1,4-benzoquinol methylase
MPSPLVQTVDTALLGLFGSAWFRLTRDATIVERTRWMNHYAQSAPQPKLRMLDVGCGSGASLLLLDRNPGKIASYLGVDRDIAGLEERFRNTRLPHEFRNVDLDSDWSFGTFDFVSCLEVIEHLLNDRHLFAKLAQSVAPGGRLVLSTPSTPFVAKMGKSIPTFDFVTPVQNGDHVRMGYTADELRAMAAENGLEVVSVDWLSRFETEELRSAHHVRSLPDRLKQNLRWPRRNAEDVFRVGGEPATYESIYWSIGICCRKPG